MKTRGLSEAVEVVVVEEGLGVARTVLSALEAVGRLGAGLDVHAVAVIDTALRVERTEIVGDMHSPAENLLPCVARTAAYSVRIAAVVDIEGRRNLAEAGRNRLGCTDRMDPTCRF